MGCGSSSHMKLTTSRKQIKCVTILPFKISLMFSAESHRLLRGGIFSSAQIALASYRHGDGYPCIADRKMLCSPAGWRSKKIRVIPLVFFHGNTSPPIIFLSWGLCVHRESVTKWRR